MYNVCEFIGYNLLHKPKDLKEDISSSYIPIVKLAHLNYYIIFDLKTIKIEKITKPFVHQKLAKINK